MIISYLLYLLIFIFSILISIQCFIVISLTIQSIRNKFGNKKPKCFLFHGTRHSFDGEMIKPQKSKVVNDEKVVFATDVFDVAVVFIADWNDNDFEFGHYSNEEHYELKEKYPNAFFKKFHGVSGWVHTIHPDDFNPDPRLGMKSEFISKEPVRILTSRRISNVHRFLKKSKKVKIIPFSSSSQ